MILVNVDWFFLSHRLPIAVALRDAGAEVWIATHDTGHRATIEAEGLRFFEVPFQRQRSGVFRELLTAIQVWWAIHKLKPRLLHNVTVKPVIFGSVLALMRRRKARPVVVNAISGFGYVMGDGHDRRTIRRCVLAGYRLALRHCGTITIFQNAEDQLEFDELGIVPLSQSVLVRGSGVSCDEFVPGEESIPPIVLFASRLLWDKGVKYFVQMAEELRRAGAKARFVIVGPADDESPAAISSATVTSWTEQGPVEWWGQRSDMAQILAEASVMVLPTYYREGVPKILLEAAAAGCPIVTTDIPGCRDIVRNGYNGFLVAPHDVSGLVHATDALLRDRHLRSVMGAAGRSLAFREFRTEVIVGQIFDVYDRLLSSRPCNRSGSHWRSCAFRFHTHI